MSNIASKYTWCIIEMLYVFLLLLHVELGFFELSKVTKRFRLSVSEEQIQVHRLKSKKNKKQAKYFK